MSLSLSSARSSSLSSDSSVRELGEQRVHARALGVGLALELRRLVGGTACLGALGLVGELGRGVARAEAIDLRHLGDPRARPRHAGARARPCRGAGSSPAASLPPPRSSSSPGIALAAAAACAAALAARTRSRVAPYAADPALVDHGALVAGDRGDDVGDLIGAVAAVVQVARRRTRCRAPTRQQQQAAAPQIARLRASSAAASLLPPAIWSSTSATSLPPTSSTRATVSGCGPRDDHVGRAPQQRRVGGRAEQLAAQPERRDLAAQHRRGVGIARRHRTGT